MDDDKSGTSASGNRGRSLVVLSLILITASLFTPNAKAQAIAGTGAIHLPIICVTPNPPSFCFGGADANYTTVVPVSDFALGDPGNSIILINTGGTAPGFVQPPAGINWIAPGGDTGCCDRGTVFDFRVFFNAATAGPITISGDLAAEGSVAAFVDGFGAYLGDQSLLALQPFSLTVNVASGSNYLDFVFNGCNDFPACLSSDYDPVSALLVDPSYLPAAPGTPVDNVPEAVGIANGGVEPATGAPEPGTFTLLGLALAALGFARKRERQSTAV